MGFFRIEKYPRGEAADGAQKETQEGDTTQHPLTPKKIGAETKPKNPAGRQERAISEGARDCKNTDPTPPVARVCCSRK